MIIIENKPLKSRFLFVENLRILLFFFFVSTGFYIFKNRNETEVHTYIARQIYLTWFPELNPINNNINGSQILWGNPKELFSNCDWKLKMRCGSLKNVFVETLKD